MNHKTLVLLSVRDEEHLVRRAMESKEAGIQTEVFFEPDLPGRTAMAALPKDGKYFRNLPLASFESS